MSIPIEEYFKYHPPLTDERISAHNQINEAALNFAKVVNSLVQNEESKKAAFLAIQQAKMFANQGATLDELEWLNLPNNPL